MKRIAIDLIWIGVGGLCVFSGCLGFDNTRYPGWINIVIGAVNLLGWGMNLGKDIYIKRQA
jgi:hypothetical protein